MVIGDAFPQTATALNLALENQRAGRHIGATVGGKAMPYLGFSCPVVFGKCRQPDGIYAHRSEIDRTILVQREFPRTSTLCFHHGKEHIRVDALCSCFVDEAFQRRRRTDSRNQSVPLQRRAERRDWYIGRQRWRKVKEQDVMESFRLSSEFTRFSICNTARTVCWQRGTSCSLKQRRWPFEAGANSIRLRGKFNSSLARFTLQDFPGQAICTRRCCATQSRR